MKKITIGKVVLISMLVLGISTVSAAEGDTCSNNLECDEPYEWCNDGLCEENTCTEADGVITFVNGTVLGDLCMKKSFDYDTRNHDGSGDYSFTFSCPTDDSWYNFPDGIKCADSDLACVEGKCVENSCTKLDGVVTYLNGSSADDKCDGNSVAIFSCDADRAYEFCSQVDAFCYNAECIPNTCEGSLSSSTECKEMAEIMVEEYGADLDPDACLSTEKELNKCINQNGCFAYQCYSQSQCETGEKCLQGFCRASNSPKFGAAEAEESSIWSFLKFWD
jgi:hypothetical protein